MKGPRVKMPLASPLPWSKTSALIGHWSEGLLKPGSLDDYLTFWTYDSLCPNPINFNAANTLPIHCHGVTWLCLSLLELENWACDPCLKLVKEHLLLNLFPHNQMLSHHISSQCHWWRGVFLKKWGSLKGCCGSWNGWVDCMVLTEINMI